MEFKTKEEARIAAKKAIKKLPVGFETETRSMLAAANLITTNIYEDSECLFVFISKKNEISTSSLIERAFLDKKSVAIPKAVGKTLEFYMLDSQREIEEQIEKGYFNILEPRSFLEKIDQSRLPLQSIFVVPGLAFALDGTRLGYGQGFYDRYIEGVYRTNSSVYLPKAIIGFCYDCQVFEELPSDDFDVPLTHIATEKRFITCES
ncbi:MAG: 5-formyltetrahydrofolate cyclo-ligase [Treponema sp.]|mgnify:CR=1 FL=1|jgi:5-formyltetrahydrofolate cyclo-ligase|nr:5-formyltetrahydrofolate cyclo-ligase [Treponema sp.]